MSYLLDTHVILWFRIQPNSLGPKALKLLGERENVLKVSAISALEIAQLVFKNRIILSQAPDVWFEDSLRYLNTRACPLTAEIFAEASDLKTNPCLALFKSQVWMQVFEPKSVTEPVRFLAFSK